jgi:hypothetical protein
MKTRISISALLVAGAIAIIMSLNGLIAKPNKTKNGFIRTFVSDALYQEKEIKFQDDIKDVCGIEHDTIYYSHMRPGIISFTTSNSIQLKTINLNLPDIQYLYPLFFTNIKYPDIKILAGNAKMIIKGDLHKNQFDTILTKTPSFSNVIFIDENTFIARMIDTPSLNAIFIKMILFKHVIVKKEKDLSQRLMDAGITNDGMLSYDPISNQLAYVNFYSNNVIVFDTSLNLLRKGNTVDTCITSSIVLAKRKTSITHAVPPKMVNKSSHAFNGILYVRSNLKADNEAADKFNENAVVDCYSMSTCRYLFSFYFPIPANSKFKRFQIVSNSKVVAIYNDRIITYNLNSKVFS